MQEHFTDGQIAELAVVMMFDVGWAKMLFTLDWAEKEPYCYYHPPEEMDAKRERGAKNDKEPAPASGD